MDAQTYCDKCGFKSAELKPVHTRVRGPVPAVYTDKPVYWCKTCRRNNVGLFRSGTNMKKSDKLNASLGNNMAASIEGPTSGGSLPSLGLAAEYRGRQRDAAAAQIDIAQIIPDPDQPRKSYDANALNDLAGSLLTHGQLQACLVRWDAAREKYVIIAGERRYRAAQIVGKTALRCVVWADDPDPTQRFELQIIENAIREDLPPIEQAEAFRTLMTARNWKASVLAEKLHLHPASVTRALALLRLPEAVRDGVAAGVISPAVGYEISKAKPEKQKNLAADAVDRKLTRDQVATQVKASKAPQTSPATAANDKPRRNTPTAPDKPITWNWSVSDGVQVMLMQGSKKVFGLLSVAKALREALARVEDEITAETKEHLNRKAG